MTKKIKSLLEKIVYAKDSDLEILKVEATKLLKDFDNENHKCSDLIDLDPQAQGWDCSK